VIDMRDDRKVANVLRVRHLASGCNTRGKHCHPDTGGMQNGECRMQNAECRMQNAEARSVDRANFE
jgi:hypothetical protein